MWFFGNRLTKCPEHYCEGLDCFTLIYSKQRDFIEKYYLTFLFLRSRAITNDLIRIANNAVLKNLTFRVVGFSAINRTAASCLKQRQ